MTALIAAQRDEHQIPHAVACRALGISRSWFCKWKDGALTPRAARRAVLAAEVRRLFRAHRGTYGSPRITAELHEAGWKVSKNTVAALRREQVWVPRTSSSSRDQAIFVDQATGASVPSDAVLLEIDWFG